MSYDSTLFFVLVSSTDVPTCHPPPLVGPSLDFKGLVILSGFPFRPNSEETMLGLMPAPVLLLFTSWELFRENIVPDIFGLGADLVSCLASGEHSPRNQVRYLKQNEGLVILAVPVALERRGLLSLS